MPAPASPLGDDKGDTASVASGRVRSGRRVTFGEHKPAAEEPPQEDNFLQESPSCSLMMRPLKPCQILASVQHRRPAVWPLLLKQGVFQHAYY